jgi:hypothetical protein
MVLGDHGDDLARVAHPDLDSLGGDHDLATLGYSPLHYDGPGWRNRDCCGSPGAAQSVPVGWLDRIWHCPEQHAVMTDHSHLGAVHPQCDPLTGQLEPHVDLSAATLSARTGAQRPPSRNDLPR